MKMRHVALVLGSLVMSLALMGATCGGNSDECVAAKKHMCEKIPDMNCYAAFMDNAQAKIIDACGEDELNAYIPAVQSACSANPSGMDCSAIAGKDYASDTEEDGGEDCDAGPGMPFSYSGTATADGRSAQLSFTVKGSTVVGGRLTAQPVCQPNVHLNSTSVDFQGTLSGTWESEGGFINADWIGGDSACDGTKLTAEDGYPETGSLTISVANGKVMLQRIIYAAEPYEFSRNYQTYTPPDCSAP